MFINPKIAIDQGWIQGIQNPDKQVQPNAIDFTLDTLARLSDGHTSPSLSETKRVMRSVTEFNPGYDGMWQLNQGVVYDGTSTMYCDLPSGIAALLYTRSTLARNGIFLISGLYDSGYQGHVGFTIYPIGGGISIEPGTRVGQIAFVSADSAKLYAGGWNHQEGTHYTSTP